MIPPNADRYWGADLDIDDSDDPDGVDPHPEAYDDPDHVRRMAAWSDDQ